MKWGDIEIGLDEHGEFLSFIERETKTRTGETSETRKLPRKPTKIKKIEVGAQSLYFENSHNIDPKKC